VLLQQQDTRWLVQNPPAHYLFESELDAVYDLGYERELHPTCRERGEARALETIRFSIATHRGCYGECTFCSIAVHQGRAVRWRNEQSILAEARAIAAHPKFKGMITDVGGPTANMYRIGCHRVARAGCCTDKHCLYPEVCDGLKTDHGRQIALLKRLRLVEGVKKVVVASGIRHDMVMADDHHGLAYLEEVVRHHVSGQMKVAPEHSEKHVLDRMWKPGTDSLVRFKDHFFRFTREAGLKQYLTHYLIAAHPGCTEGDMEKLREFALRELGHLPEQVQLFTPSPSTYASLMYWTGRDPFTGEELFVEKGAAGRQRQKDIMREDRR
jgi:uncharacterized radical SAM protein YgiQ